MNLYKENIYKSTLPNIYKILGIYWFCEIFRRVPAFLTADNYNSRNPIHFIYITDLIEPS